MKLVGILLIGALTLANCGGNQAPNRSEMPRQTSNIGEQKIRCVSQGGFLVPSGNDFACRLENGQTIGLSKL